MLTRKSRFIEMFGDPVYDNKQWGKQQLAKLLIDIRYGTSTPPDFSDTGYAFIRATNIKNGYIINTNMIYISNIEAIKIQKCQLKTGDMIIVRSGINAGDTCVVTKNYEKQYAGYDIILELNKNNINPAFLNILMNTQYMEKIVKPLTRRAAQPHLNSEQVQSLPIIKVPVKLQNQFASFVFQLDKSKFAVRRAIGIIEQWLGIMT